MCYCILFLKYNLHVHYILYMIPHELLDALMPYSSSCHKHVQTDFPNYIHIQHDFDRPAWNCKFAGQSWIWTAMVTWVLEIVHEAEHVFPGRVELHFGQFCSRRTNDWKGVEGVKTCASQAGVWVLLSLWWWWWWWWKPAWESTGVVWPRWCL